MSIQLRMKSDSQVCNVHTSYIVGIVQFVVISYSSVKNGREDIINCLVSFFRNGIS